MGKLPKTWYPAPAVQAYRMSQLFPDFKYSRRKGSWTGHLQPSLSSPRYRVQITYLSRGMPIVRVLQPQIWEKAPHTYGDGSLCLYYSDGSWSNSKMIAETIVPWTAEWLLFYEYWQATGKWLGPEAPHSGRKEIITDR